MLFWKALLCHTLLLYVILQNNIWKITYNFFCKYSLFFSFATAMRAIIIILSCYILAISAMPCSDGFNECATTQAKHETHNHGNDQTDHCSPFCVCACCGMVVTPKVFRVSTQPIKLSIAAKQKFPIREFDFSSNFYKNIWQPPKIS